MDSLEEEMATHSSILAGKIPWTEDPGGLQPGGVHGGRRVGLDRASEHACGQTAVGCSAQTY